jgi:hypothetical protein
MHLKSVSNENHKHIDQISTIYQVHVCVTNQVLCVQQGKQIGL